MAGTIEKCAFCGAEADLYHVWVPICPKCAEGYKRLAQETEEKPEPPPNPEPEDLKRSG